MLPSLSRSYLAGLEVVYVYLNDGVVHEEVRELEAGGEERKGRAAEQYQGRALELLGHQHDGLRLVDGDPCEARVVC